MRTHSAYRSWRIWIAASVTALGCGGPDEPPPRVTLSLTGQVRRAEPAPAPLPGATVALRHFTGLLGNPVTITETTTDQDGNYHLTHTLTSVCEPQDNTTDWVEVSAQGYEPASSFTVEAGQFSDPPIYCTNDPQVIDFSLQPTSTN